MSTPEPPTGVQVGWGILACFCGLIGLCGYCLTCCCCCCCCADKAKHKAELEKVEEQIEAKKLANAKQQDQANEVPKDDEVPKINEMSKGTDESHTESKDV
ncbi:PREDICTED: dnaJ homolog subfamily C member 5 [Prunus dulcis]|uniref:PREDICTED: dnaJ homolog subfamily C member 5 n=1 Tax=Prunus dulcis TaxID=3755 RepID=A0A5E4G167_PRUDU|nr:PREDICTED: dnaJ homolog subfamily C member 5 [Prunus dulcis]